MDSEELARAADRTLAFAWAALGRNGCFPVVVGPSMTLFASGTPFAFYNGAIATAPATDPDSVVRGRAFFAGKYRFWRGRRGLERWRATAVLLTPVALPPRLRSQ